MHSLANARSAQWSRPTRRRVLSGLVGLIVAGGASSAGLAAPLTAAEDDAASAGRSVPETGARRIALRSLNTGERVDVAYWQRGRYDPAGLAQLDAFMRDWRTDEIGQMDPALYDLLWAIGQSICEDPEFTVLCGYRSPATTTMLVRAGTNGIARDSLHMQGKAADITLNGASLSTLRDTAMALQAGGVGYYGRSNFVHVDTGIVRSW
ncbi:MAG: DUF882 domain-containing protein [Alphaproteobacteria bacterium]